MVNEANPEKEQCPFLTQWALNHICFFHIIPEMTYINKDPSPFLDEIHNICQFLDVFNNDMSKTASPLGWVWSKAWAHDSTIISLVFFLYWEIHVLLDTNVIPSLTGTKGNQWCSALNCRRKKIGHMIKVHVSQWSLRIASRHWCYCCASSIQSTTLVRLLQ